VLAESFNRLSAKSGELQFCPIASRIRVVKLLAFFRSFVRPGRLSLQTFDDRPQVIPVYCYGHVVFIPSFSIKILTPYAACSLISNFVSTNRGASACAGLLICRVQFLKGIGLIPLALAQIHVFFPLSLPAFCPHIIFFQAALRHLSLRFNFDFKSLL
jgi:hypothetical protein